MTTTQIIIDRRHRSRDRCRAARRAALAGRAITTIEHRHEKADAPEDGGDA